MADAEVADQLKARGYAIVPWDAATAAWSRAALQVARPILSDPSQRARWIRHGGTWFAGVDVLPNEADGSVSGQPLSGPAFDVIRDLGLWPKAWHRAQVSATYPGYPQPDPDEAPGPARYRRTRDAAHLDGLLPIGADRRRMLREPHSFILGLPLTEAAPDAAPLVVWPGSHHIFAEALGEVLKPHPHRDWPEQDLTEIYAATRRQVFETCPRLPLAAAPGEAILLHRLLLHGIAPWAAGAQAAPEGRVIAYFRPCLETMSAWIDAP